MKNNKGFAPILLISIILGVALLGAIGYIFYQNMASNSSDKYKGYIVLNDWGVKFKIPTELQAVTINKYKKDGYYYFTTSRSEAIKFCAWGDDGLNAALYALGRYEKTQEDVASGGQFIAKISKYYYYASPPQAPCWSADASEKDKDIISEEIGNLGKLLRNIEAL